MPAVVGEHSRQLSCGPLRNVFLDGVPGGHPQEHHTAVGKETGETAHVERWNNTLRQRLARFVRMTLSFSRLVLMLRPRVCSPFSIASIESGLSFSSEPLPVISLPLCCVMF